MALYLLYCAQDAGFQTRSMLVPYDKYISSKDLVKDFDVLRQYAKQQVFVIDGTEYHIDNLLLQNIVWDGGCGKMESTEYGEIVSRLTMYADGLDDDQISPSACVWYDDTIINLCSGFNHIKNYCKLRNMTTFDDKPIKIVEGFLILQTNNGKLRLPSVDTVKEMYQKYYQQN